MKKSLLLLIGIFSISLAYSATINDENHHSVTVEQSWTNSVLVNQNFATSKTDIGASLPVQCGAQTYYGNCCGQTVTCGWLFVCVNNGVITYMEYFSACNDPLLCIDVPGCIPSNPA